MLKEIEEKYWEDLLSILYDDSNALRRYRVCVSSIVTNESKLSFLKYLDGKINSHDIDTLLRENYENNAGNKQLPWYDKRVKEIEELKDKIQLDILELTPFRKKRNTSIPYLEIHEKYNPEKRIELIRVMFHELTDNGFITCEFDLFDSLFIANGKRDLKVNWIGTQTGFALFFDRLKELKIITTHKIYKALELSFTINQKIVSNKQLSVASQKSVSIREGKDESNVDDIIDVIKKLILN